MNVVVKYLSQKQRKVDIVLVNVEIRIFKGRVRGILCFNCNVGLGNFKDSIQFLYNAIHYLEQNK